jgi:hypothetical protein
MIALVFFISFYVVLYLWNWRHIERNFGTIHCLTYDGLGEGTLNLNSTLYDYWRSVKWHCYLGVISVSVAVTVSAKVLGNKYTCLVSVKAFWHRAYNSSSFSRNFEEDHVGFVVDTVTLGQIFYEVLRFALSVSFHKYSTYINTSLSLKQY